MFGGRVFCLFSSLFSKNLECKMVFWVEYTNRSVMPRLRFSIKICPASVGIELERVITVLLVIMLF